MSGIYWPTGNRDYRVEMRIVPTAGDPFYVTLALHAEGIFSE
jgi:hypothetical protein